MNSSKALHVVNKTSPNLAYDYTGLSSGLYKHLFVWALCYLAGLRPRKLLKIIQTSPCTVWQCFLQHLLLRFVGRTPLGDPGQGRQDLKKSCNLRPCSGRHAFQRGPLLAVKLVKVGFEDKAASVGGGWWGVGWGCIVLG